MTWKTVKLGEVLKRVKNLIEIEDEKEYKLVTVRLYHKGVTLRKVALGNELSASKMHAVKSGEFILSGIDARHGAFGIVPEELEGAVVSNDFWCLEFDEKIIDKHLFLKLTSTSFFDDLCKKASDGTTNRVRLQADKFFNLEILLPPLEEQKKLSEEFRVLETANTQLSAELSQQLQWVRALRQAFLREAMRGQIVPQDEADEPAAALLERIKTEKEQLVAQKKIKRDKPLPAVAAEEIPFEIPSNWVWCRLGEVCEINPRNKADDDLESGFVPMLLIAQKFGQSPNFEKRLWKNIKSGFTHFADNDVVVAKITPCFENSKAGIISNLPNGIGAGTTELYVLRKVGDIPSEFIYACIKTRDFLTNGERNMRGVAGQKRIPTSYVSNALLPLPPLAEQARIVAKLETLMAFCDGLESSIRESASHAQSLLQVALKEALSPPS